jgi:hypothetical protein
LRRVIWQRFAEVSEMLAASITRAMTHLIMVIMEAENISETSVNFYREKLKS